MRIWRVLYPDTPGSVTRRWCRTKKEATAFRRELPVEQRKAAVIHPGEIGPTKADLIKFLNDYCCRSR